MVPELSVNNFKNSLAFYNETLGFNILYTRKNPDFAYLDQHQVQIMIEQVHQDTWRTGVTEYPFGRGINFQIELPDISPVYQRLKSIEYPFYREIKENWYQTEKTESGQKEFLIQDPDGYLLRFSQYLGER